MASHLTRRAALTGGLFLTLAGPALAQADSFSDAPERQLNPEQWRARLSGGAFDVLRRHHTELPFTSALNGERRVGTYICAGCRLPLFRSQWKYNSRTGWPSFFRATEAHIGTRLDRSLGMRRTEYHCARCLGHQGHLFDDGPAPTGLRYCNNGLALAFTPD